MDNTTARKIAVVTDLTDVVIGSGAAALKALRQKILNPDMLEFIISGVNVEDSEHPKLKKSGTNPLGHFIVNTEERIPKVRFYQHDGYTVDEKGNPYKDGVLINQE